MNDDFEIQDAAPCGQVSIWKKQIYIWICFFMTEYLLL